MYVHVLGIGYMYVHVLGYMYIVICVLLWVYMYVHVLGIGYMSAMLNRTCGRFLNMACSLLKRSRAEGRSPSLLKVSPRLNNASEHVASTDSASL